MASPAPLRRSRRGLALLLVVTLALAAASCSQAAAAPTQAQYVAQADEVCRATDDRLDELQADYDVARVEAASEGESSEDQRPDRWTRARVVPAYQELDATLRSIRPPEDDGTYLVGLYDDLSQRIEELRITPSDGRDVIRADTDLRKRFSTYGMKVCGRV